MYQGPVNISNCLPINIFSIFQKPLIFNINFIFVLFIVFIWFKLMLFCCMPFMCDYQDIMVLNKVHILNTHEYPETLVAL